VTVDLLAGVRFGGHAQADTCASIENVYGSSFADFIIGNAYSNVLNGTGGDDLLVGGAGHDTLIGGTGSPGKRLRQSAFRQHPEFL
jgi:Ca2+-binding RTX toxin-like protein